MMDAASRHPVTIMALHQGYNPGHDLHSECSPPALDLSRKRPPSPDYPYGLGAASKRSFVSPPCSTSPKSDTSSEISVSSDPLREFPVYHTATRIKPTRPFKAYPKDPMSLAMGVTPTESLLANKDSTGAYNEFRQRMLSQVQSSNGTNKNMRRNSQSSQNPQNADPSYWEKRRKNNEAAKRSRDARRAKEDEIAIRCAFLEQENIQLKFRIAALESERERLQGVTYH